MNTSPAKMNASLTSNNTNTATNRTVVTAIALLMAMLFSACTPGFGGGGGDEIQSNEGSPIEVSSADVATAYSASSTRAIVDADHVVVYQAPDGPSMSTLPGATSYGTKRVMLVEAIVGDWVQVRLPTRPNHRLGWVRSTDVTIQDVEPVVHIDLEARTLTVIADDAILAQATVAVGSTENPTPIGTFYVTDKLETPNPDGAYGPYAFGLSGFSETLSEFAGGNGQIGIHGTNDPTSIGQAVSHGCIRLSNELTTWLVEVLPLGTPVHIV
jgi:lipoprotein-anchoring transpeptidase ErfK/SrfK